MFFAEELVCKNCHLSIQHNILDREMLYFIIVLQLLVSSVYLISINLKLA
jgi:hypothetical protein